MTADGVDGVLHFMLALKQAQMAVPAPWAARLPPGSPRWSGQPSSSWRTRSMSTPSAKSRAALVPAFSASAER